MLKVNDPSAQTNRDGLCAITCSEFLHDVLDVNLYRFLGDEEFFRNVTVPVSARDLAENLHLPVG